jgi:hypothetical protein
MKSSANYLDIYQRDLAETTTGYSVAKQKARELADLAAQSNHPITKLPPEPIPMTRPGHRWFSKGSSNAIKDQPIPESQKQIKSRYLGNGSTPPPWDP